MKINEVYQAESPDYALRGVHRVLWLNQELDLAIIIPVPNVAAGETRNYFKQHRRTSIAALELAIDSGLLQLTFPKPPPLACLSDTQIRERYPGRNGKESAPLATRDAYIKALRPILQSLTNNRRAFFEDDGLAPLIAEAVKTSGFGDNQIRNAMNRYLALGIGNNSLLPFRHACGAPGKVRDQRTRLGRKTLAHQAGLTESSGIALTQEAKDDLAWGWRVFMDGKNAVEDAYDLTMGVFWADGTHIKHGEKLPTLLPADQRPTLAQFRRWGPKGEGNKDAWLTLLDHQEWEKNYRARYGTVLDGIRAVGQTAVGDATGGDLHLVSMTSRLRPIGYSNRLILHDAFSDIIAGFHIGLDAPSEEVALLAVLNAATSKVEYCRQYGVDIEEDDIPQIFFAKYLVDNGEYRTRHAIATLAALGAGIELTTVGRAEKKGRSEAHHRSLHKLGSHKVTGTTKGRQAKRGEAKPALLACWRYHEHVRLQLQAIKFFNCEMPVPAFMNNHPCRTAMKRDGVPPIRKAIYQWGLRKGLIASPPFNEEHLRAALLPEMKASVQATGVYLLRPDRGRRKDLVKSHRFIGPRATELQWLERARRSGPFTIRVRVNPNELQRIWYADETGFHELLNRNNDTLLVQFGTLADSLAIQDQDVIDETLERDRTDQARADLVMSRTAADEAYKREKKAEISAATTKPTKKSLTDNVRENRQAELDAAAKADSTGGRTHEEAPAKHRSTDKEVASLQHGTSPASDWMDDILQQHREG